MNLKQIIARLRAGARPQDLEGMARVGITPDRAFGTKIPTLRKLAREIGRDHDLALQLWDAGGGFEPGEGSFVLKRIDEQIPGRQLVLIELIGSNVRVDEAQKTVSVDVAMRNAGPEALYAPAAIWLASPMPPTVKKSR